MTMVEKYLKMINDLAKYRSKARAKELRIDMLTKGLERQDDTFTKEEKETLSKELERVKREDY